MCLSRVTQGVLLYQARLPNSNMVSWGFPALQTKRQYQGQHSDRVQLNTRPDPYLELPIKVIRINSETTTLLASPAINTLQKGDIGQQGLMKELAKTCQIDQKQPHISKANLNGRL